MSTHTRSKVLRSTEQVHVRRVFDKNQRKSATSAGILIADCERTRIGVCAFEACAHTLCCFQNLLQTHKLVSQFWHNRQRKCHHFPVSHAKRQCFVISPEGTFGTNHLEFYTIVITRLRAFRSTTPLPRGSTTAFGRRSDVRFDHNSREAPQTSD